MLIMLFSCVGNGTKTLAAICSAAAACHHKMAVPFQREIDLRRAFVGKCDFDCCDGETVVQTVCKILSGKSGIYMPCMLGTLEEFEDETKRVLARLERHDLNAWGQYRKEALKGELDPPGEGSEAVGGMYVYSSE